MTRKLLLQFAFTASLIAIAIIWRVVNYNLQFAPNLEIVTSVAVIAAITLGFRAALIVPLVSMAVSDFIIGNTAIFVFTWSAFLLIGAGALVLKRLNNRPKQQVLASIGFAVASSFVFFVITNFGVWAQGWYPATWAGLVDCFVMAIPFYRTMLLGNVILVPVAVIAWQAVRSHQTVKKSVINSLVR